MWDDTKVEFAGAEAACYHNVFTGECTQLSSREQNSPPVAKLLRHFPVALLLSEATDAGAGVEPVCSALFPATT